MLSVASDMGLTIVHRFQYLILIATLVTSTSSLESNGRQFVPRSLNCTEDVCAVGQALDLTTKQVGNSTNSSCVPLSARCSFACQQNAPNCTCFNYYATNGTCEFFGGSILNVTNQTGCALWAVRMRIIFTFPRKTFQ